jgi:hypothetical protein
MTHTITIKNGTSYPDTLLTAIIDTNTRKVTDLQIRPPDLVEPAADIARRTLQQRQRTRFVVEHEDAGGAHRCGHCRQRDEAEARGGIDERIARFQLRIEEETQLRDDTGRLFLLHRVTPRRVRGLGGDVKAGRAVLAALRALERGHDRRR